MGLPCRCAAVIRFAAVVSQRVKTLCHSTRMYPIWRLREQARSHRDLGCEKDC